MSAGSAAASGTAATPGPWIAEPSPTELCAFVYGKGRKRGQRRQLVAQVWSGDDCSLEVALKNAQLLSAAPDLAEALELALEGLRTALGGTAQVDTDHHPAIVAGVAALKKANIP